MSVYLKLANKPYSYLLESVQGGERFGRYSFVGLPARTRYEVRGNHCRELCGDEVVAQSEQADPLAWVAEQQAKVRAAPRPELPRFLGGLVGCFGYETVRYIEKRLAASEKPDALKTPDILLLLSEQIVAVDNLSGKLYLVVYADPAPNKDAWQRAQKRLEELFGNAAPARCSAARKRRPVQCRQSPRSLNPTFMNGGRARQSNTFVRWRHHASRALAADECAVFGASPLSLYRALRALNPSPYMFYFDMGDFHIVGSSPEILVRLENGVVTLRPIAGTRPRG